MGLNRSRCPLLTCIWAASRRKGRDRDTAKWADGSYCAESLCLRKRDPDPLQKHNIVQLDTCPSPRPPNARGLGHRRPTDSCSTLIPQGSQGHQEPCTGDGGAVISVLSSHQYWLSTASCLSENSHVSWFSTLHSRSLWLYSWQVHKYSLCLALQIGKKKSVLSSLEGNADFVHLVIFITFAHEP